MTTRKPMADSDPKQCVPGPFPLYIIAPGKSNFYDNYARAFK